MTEVQSQPTPATRTAGALAIVTGIAALALLAAHPEGGGNTFAEYMKSEAATRVMSGIVHGGFIFVLSLQIVAYAMLSGRLGLSRISTMAGLVFFACGAAFMSGNLLMDGLTSPGVAVRYLPVPDKVDYARSLFVLIANMTRFMMPIGLAFQSAAIAAWGWALTAAGRRALGLFAILMGTATVVAIGANAILLFNPFVLMGAIVATAVWAIAVGIAMVRGL
jgi:hypothetical protein